MGKPPQPEMPAAAGKATSPAAQAANCALDAASAWHCPRALGRTNETRASATMRRVCWCLSRALCTDCQAESPRATQLRHAVSHLASYTAGFVWRPKRASWHLQRFPWPNTNVAFLVLTAQLLPAKINSFHSAVKTDVGDYFMEVEIFMYHLQYIGYIIALSKLTILETIEY